MTTQLRSERDIYGPNGTLGLEARGFLDHARFAAWMADRGRCPVRPQVGLLGVLTKRLAVDEAVKAGEKLALAILRGEVEPAWLGCSTRLDALDAAHRWLRLVARAGGAQAAPEHAPL